MIHSIAAIQSTCNQEPDMMINSIHFTFAPKDADIAESLFRELRDVSRKEAGVIQFEVGRSREKPNVFALWEVYRDQEAVDAHVTSEHFQRLVVNGVRPLAQDRNIERVVPI
jgi:quinol monooxygenase YgiN